MWYGCVFDFLWGSQQNRGQQDSCSRQKTKILLDFGQSFVFGEKYFTGYLSPRGVNGLGDYFMFDLLPRIEGLYSKDMLAFCDLPYCEPKIDAVFVSHAHFDHINHLQFLDPQIPIYTGFGTKLFMECMEETGYNSYYGQHPIISFGLVTKSKWVA